MQELQEKLKGFIAMGGDLGERPDQHKDILNRVLEQSLPSGV